MKYFVISDIHSHYDAMILALEKHGYDTRDKTHHLLVLGDIFDRGPQAKEVLDYLYHLNMLDKATIILGNHDSFLIDFLKKQHQRTFFNVVHNGFGKTLFQLSGIKPTMKNLNLVQETIEMEYSFLLKWLESFPYYLEIGDYIFVHGGIDGKVHNWKNKLSKRDYIWSREFNLTEIPGKIIVAGHHRVATIISKTKDYPLLFQEHPEFFDILYLDGKILIDRFVEVSNEINVLILDI